MNTLNANPVSEFDADVLKHFESLGDNCEFGLVQVALGVDQLGFFRFNNSGFEPLLAVLGNGFRDFRDPQDLILETACNNELIVFVPRYGFRYHTFQQADEVDQPKLLVQQKRVLSWLARKALDDLRAGEKVFIRKQSGAVDTDEISRLYRALQTYGPNRLLWVSDSEKTESLGRVEPVRTVGQGAYIGYMDRFSQYQDASAFSYTWFHLCRTALCQINGWPLASTADFDGAGEAGTYVLCSLRDVIQAHNCWDEGCVLENVMVHGPEGVVTVGNTVLEETLAADSSRRIQRDRVSGLRLMTLPRPGFQVRVAAAYHLFGHSEAELDSRYRNEVYKRFCAFIETPAPVILLIPERTDFVILAALRKLVHTRMPRLSVPRGAVLAVRQLFLPKY